MVELSPELAETIAGLIGAQLVARDGIEPPTPAFSGLAQALQELPEQDKEVEISWLWDGGIDVNAGGEERNFRRVADVIPWLRHWYGLKVNDRDQLASELHKIYDSEIHLTIRTGGKRILLALGTDLTGFEGKEDYANSASEIPPRLQALIHEHDPISKYDVERLGGEFTDEMPRITE